jgi:hypothetical protein
MAKKHVPHDQDPKVPGNIADSPQRRGEDVAKQEQEPGRSDVKPHGRAQRPAGKSTARDQSGVAPKDPITRDNPAG